MNVLNNYRVLLLACTVAIGLLPGILMGYGIGRQFADDSNPWIFFTIGGGVIFVALCYVVIRDKIYPEFAKIEEYK